MRLIRSSQLKLRFSRTALWLCLAGGAGGFDGSAQEAGTLSLTGRVINALTGAPISRVLVQANSHSVFTDHEGRFVIADSSAIASVQFTKPGFSLSPEQLDGSSVETSASSRPVPLEVELWPAAVLTGTVLDLMDEPVAQLTVFAQRKVFQSGKTRIQSAGFAVTDSHGNFRLPVPAGEYRLETRYSPSTPERPAALLPAQAPADGTRSSFLSISSGQEMHLDLHPGSAVAHRFLVAFDGLPEGQFPALTVQTANGASFPVPSKIVPGGLALDLPAGEYRLSARVFSQEGARSGEASINVPDHAASGPAIPMETLPNLPITISVDPADAGDPTLGTKGAASVPNAFSLNLGLERLDGGFAEFGDIMIRPQNRGGVGPSFMTAPGAYRLNGGDGNGWVLEEASFGGLDLLRSDLVLGPSVGGEAIHLLVSRRGGGLTGITRIAGRPAACWVVLADDLKDRHRFLVRRSKMDGTINLSGLRLGEYQALALPLLHSADFSNSEVMQRFHGYVQTVLVGATTRTLSLEAVPVHELYP